MKNIVNNKNWDCLLISAQFRWKQVFLIIQNGSFLCFAKLKKKTQNFILMLLADSIICIIKKVKDKVIIWKISYIAIKKDYMNFIQFETIAKKFTIDATSMITKDVENVW